jgi:signal peptidase I
VAAISAAFFRYFFVEAYRIPNDFMSPTLLPGDHIFLKNFNAVYNTIHEKFNSFSRRTECSIWFT